MNRSELLEVAHRNLVDSFKYRMDCAGGVWVQGDGWQVYDIGSGVASSHLRGAILDADAQPQSLMEELRERGYGPGCKVLLRVHPDAAERVGSVLENQGFRCQEPGGFPMMTIERPARWEATHRVELVPLSEGGEAVAAEAVATLLSAFTALTPEDAGKLLLTRACTTSARCRLAVVRDQSSGRVVCAGMLIRSIDPTVAGLYYIATDPQYRGQGLAKDLCAALIDHAFEGGARLVTLQASPLGEFVYRRLGFTEVGRCYVFERR